MSSGLVATMGMPASAAGRNAAGPEVAAAPATAPIAVQPALAFQGGLIAASADQTATAAPLTAPAAATVSFESNAFKAVPKKVMTVSSASNSQGQSTVSASLSTSSGSARGSSIIAIAARYVGVPYVYGGTTPAHWDCSGATSYIYRQVGINIPRTANEQLLASGRVSRSEAKPGDLVFFLSGGRAYHVGIYAGGNMMYDAGRTGETFSKRAIFSANVLFGRFAA